MISIPHKKFVYISSIDEAKDSPYGVTKRLSEIIVKELCDEYLILRPSGLLGKEMKTIGEEHYSWKVIAQSYINVIQYVVSTQLLIEHKA